MDPGQTRPSVDGPWQSPCGPLAVASGSTERSQAGLGPVWAGLGPLIAVEEGYTPFGTRFGPSWRSSGTRLDPLGALYAARHGPGMDHLGTPGVRQGSFGFGLGPLGIAGERQEHSDQWGPFGTERRPTKTVRCRQALVKPSLAWWLGPVWPSCCPVFAWIGLDRPCSAPLARPIL